jgi:hypothetical protein
MIRQTCVWLGLGCGGGFRARDCAPLQSPLPLYSRAAEADLVSRRKIGSACAEDLVVHSTQRRGCVAAEDAWVEVGGVACSAVAAADV